MRDSAQDLRSKQRRSTSVSKDTNRHHNHGRISYLHWRLLTHSPENHQLGANHARRVSFPEHVAAFSAHDQEVPSVLAVIDAQGLAAMGAIRYTPEVTGAGLKSYLGVGLSPWACISFHSSISVLKM